jgi:sugar phosphate isomerase/epimerase
MEEMMKKSMFSMSTSWANNRFETGDALVETFMEMNFDKAELNYNVTEKMVNEIFPYVDRGEFEITSVHHPFPKNHTKEYGVDSVMLGFVEEDKRQTAVEVTKRSIDFADRLGAKAVVIHPSEVPMSVVKYDRKLKELYKEGKKNSKEYKDLFNEIIELRDAGSHIHSTKTAESLHELCEYIGKKGYNIKLGLENRASIHQIPDFYEANYILSKTEDLPVYFWYDIGHGIMMEKLGVFNNMEEFKKIRHRTLGVHIHDVKLLQDHYAPLQISDYLKEFIPYFREIPIKVLEIMNFVDSDIVVDCAKRLEEEFVKGDKIYVK